MDDDDDAHEPQEAAGSEEGGSINDPLTRTDVDAPRVPFESEPGDTAP
jgi:hypothetical protein